MDLPRSKRSYYWTSIALLLLLVATVALAYVRLGPFSVTVALAIATAKAFLVACYFMHLRFSHGIIRLFAGAGLVWLATLFLLTFADYIARGRPVSWERPFASGLEDSSRQPSGRVKQENGG